ncbi:MAG: RHS repeat-associated core domain-containing protein [Chitinophagaceae bacterium]
MPRQRRGYYPFGLTMAGISSKALAFGSPENRYKFNEGTELEHKEFNNGAGLEWYSTEFRKYDPQIGRFHQIDNLSFLTYDYSPYTFANNNPILLNDPLGLTGDTAWKELAPVVVTAKIPKPLDTENGQVLPPRSRFWDFWEGNRTWQAYPGSFYRHAVDHRGYIIPNAPSPPIKFEINIPPVSFTRINLRAVFNLKNWIKGRFAIYRGKKFNGELYIGKATTKDGSLSFRYSADEILELEATVIKGLDNIPNNAIALGVEQLIIDLNGGIRGVNVANKIPATVKEIYMIEARYWLNQNLPNWETLLKFQ